jgi:arylsulfatase A-like enzyme
VLPTLLECAGIQIPPLLQGRSLRPVLDGARETGRDSALMEQRGWKSLRTRRFRYVCESSGHELLWDVEADPHEHREIAADLSYADALADLRRQLIVRVLENEQPLPRVWNY